MIEILTSGAGNMVQDLGRAGLLDIGVGRCGAMDTMAFVAGNTLLGNHPSAAGIEIAYFPFRLRLTSATSVAVMGADCAADLAGTRLPPCWATRAEAGDELTLSPPRTGARAYLLFSGGIDVPMMLGSRSTDLKSGFGGVSGRSLNRGDRIALAEPIPCRLPEGGLGALPYEEGGTLPARHGATVTVRVLPAAEHQFFTEASTAAFHSQEWTITADANRMGYRLSGPTLEISEPRELFSHGIVPGTVQVPPNGQPIIQLVDANTCGGYAKIATVIEADLWRLAQASPGARLMFRDCEASESVEAIRRQRDHLLRVRNFANLLRSQ